MANYRRAQSKNNNRVATLVVVLLLVALSLAGAAFALLMPGSATSASPAAEGPLPDLELEREEGFPVEEFHYLLNASPSFNKKGEKGSVYLENCDGNRDYMQVVYTLESGEEVYQSPLLPPNWSVQTDRLNKQLEPGEYEAVANVYVYPSAEAEEYIALFEETIHITVG